MWGMRPARAILDLLPRGSRTRMIRVVQNPFQTSKMFWNLHLSKQPASD